MLLNKHLLAGWFVLAIFIASTFAQNSKDEPGQIAPYQGERNNVFDWNLLKNLLKSNKGNVLLSPTSLRFVLALIYVGARRNSALELQKVMHLPATRPAMRRQYSNLIKSLQKQSSEYELNIGTQIFMQNGVSLRPKYEQIVRKHYNSDVSLTDFKNTAAAAEAINKYVKDLTKGNIEKIIDDESTLQDNLMVLVNALYFKGKWSQSFEKEHTKVDGFHTSDGKTVEVPYMRAKGDFNLAYDKDDLNAQILRLPYAGNKYSMYIVLPESDGKLDDLVEKINPEVISKNLKNMYETEAKVQIPKFKFDFTNKNLKDNLIEMGIKDIFGDSANLSGILSGGPQNLYVTDIVQKAGIEVSEEGTTAYAATEAGIAMKMLPRREYFIANRPFLFYIEDDTNGEVLFMGRVNNPLEGNN